jgi:hypothetical protein
MLLDLFLATCIVAFLVNGMITLFYKIGLLDWLDMKAKKEVVSKMLGCLFCLSHHLAFIPTLILMYFDFNLLYLFVPLMVAGILNKL